MKKPLRGLSLTVATIVFGASFVACPLLTKKPPADDEIVADAATTSVSGTGAKNEANVLRYANETPIANEPAVIGKDGAHARSFPGNGPEVAFLVKGTAVAKIAQYFSTGVLVMFDDPGGDGSKLIGWVSPKVFDLAAPVPAKPVYVPPKVDAGSASAPKDAGAVVVDAGGATPAKDAGGAAPVVDAGSGTISKGPVAVPSVGGKCQDPARVLDKDTMCRYKCNADGDCPRGIKCLAKPAGKLCTSG